MLSRSPRSVDLSLLNRCCLNSELCKFWSLPNRSSPLIVGELACVCAHVVVLKERRNKREVSHISDHFPDAKHPTVGGSWRYGHIRLILVIPVDHIAASVNLNYTSTVLASTLYCVAPPALHCSSLLCLTVMMTITNSLTPTKNVRFFFRFYRLSPAEKMAVTSQRQRTTIRTMCWKYERKPPITVQVQGEPSRRTVVSRFYGIYLLARMTGTELKIMKLDKAANRLASWLHLSTSILSFIGKKH